MPQTPKNMYTHDRFGYKTVEEIIKVTGLDLSSYNPKLSNIWLRYTRNLVKLKFYSNNVKTIPPVIYKLFNLTSLNLSHNKLKVLPKKFFINCVALKELDLSYNVICKLPKYIGSLKHLTVLHIQNNRLTRIPVTIEKLQSLEYISICDNNFNNFPTHLFKLPKLKQMDINSKYMHNLMSLTISGKLCKWTVEKTTEHGGVIITIN